MLSYRTLWGLLICAFSINKIVCQETISVNGFLTDETSSPVSFAVVSINEVIIESNEYGYFSVKLDEPDKIEITIDHIGYEKLDTLIRNPSSDISVKFVLRNIVLPEVSVSAVSVQSIKENPDREHISAKLLESSPAVMGEPDIIKYISTFAGISGGRESLSQFTVRGGGIFENQIYFDGVPVYNSGHFLGLVSVFNSSIIQSADVYKGYAPSEYGGRLSSVLDIHAKDGSLEDLTIKADIGTVDSDISIEGPLGKSRKVSFIAAGRAFYIFPLVREITDQNNGINYYFYDFNGKIRVKLNNDGELTASYMYVPDVQSERLGPNSSDVEGGSLQKVNLSNSILSLQYHQPISSNWYIKAIGGITNVLYNSDLSSTYKFTDAKEWTKEDEHLHSSQRDIYGKVDIQQTKYGHFSSKMGLEFVHHDFGGISYKYSHYIDDHIEQDIDNAHEQDPLTEISLYWESKFQLKRITVNSGLRINSGLGQENYSLIDPQLSISYAKAEARIILASRVQSQFMHAVASSQDEVIPFVYWIGTNEDLQPNRAITTSLTYQRHLLKRNLWFSVGGFYKYYPSVSDNYLYSDYGLAQFVSSPKSFLIADTQGNSYGVEIESTFKPSVKWKVDLNYTWLKSYRQKDGINQGNKYPFRYSRDHEINAQAIFRPKEKWSFVFNFILASGQKYTYPTSVSGHSNFIEYYSFYFDSINNTNLPLYSRLDIGAHWKKLVKKDYYFGVRFGLYNAYNATNPVTVTPTYINGQIKVKGLFLIPIVPYLNLTFDYKT